MKLIILSLTVLFSVAASPTDSKLAKTLADKLEVDFCWLLTGDRGGETKVRLSELFKEVKYFDGYARIRIDHLVPINSKNDEDKT
jgi:hypothetical protein